MTNSKENDRTAEEPPDDTDIAETNDLRIQLDISDGYASTPRAHKISSNIKHGQSSNDIAKPSAASGGTFW